MKLKNEIHYNHIKSVLINHCSSVIIQKLENNGATTREKRSSGLPTRSDTYQAVKAQKMT